MIEIDLEVTIEITGPFLSKSSGVGAYGIDSAAFRDHAGNPVIPGSHVKGRSREQMEILRSAMPNKLSSELVRKWFGPPVNLNVDDVGIDDRPRFASWYFGDFTCTDKNVQDEPATYTRIKIDSRTGAVEHGALQVIECALAPNEAKPFTGTVTIVCETEQVELAIKALHRSISMIPSLGSFRSVGFGKVKSVQCKACETRFLSCDPVPQNFQSSVNDLANVPVRSWVPNPVLANSNDAAAKTLVVELEDSFCVGQRRTNRNIYRSVDDLGGPVLKGALAFQLQRLLGKNPGEDLAGHNGAFEAVCQNFASMRICNARPASSSSIMRPVAQPISLFKTTSTADQVFDAALESGAFLTRNGEDQSAPAFSVDWKSSTLEGFDTDGKSPRRELRLRTAIDSEQRRAKDEHLFGYELVHPFDSESGEPLHWLGRIELSSIDSSLRSQIWNELQSAFDLLVFRIGKTKTRARFRLIDEQPQNVVKPIEAGTEQLYVVTLQSNCLLLDIEEIATAWEKDGKDKSTELYRSVFTELSNGSLSLRNRYALEELHGGFPVHRAQKGSYHPAILSQAGSVFVFSVLPGKEADAAAAVGNWQLQGLPIPEWVAKEYGTNYTSNPFLPSAGFGEIRVNCQKQMGLKLPEIVRLK